MSNVGEESATQVQFLHVLFISGVSPDKSERLGESPSLGASNVISLSINAV